MYDYMKALLQRFDTHSEQAAALEKSIEKTRKNLANRLTKSERKMLLRLSDLEDALRDETSLNSFMCGYRLASGIHQELSKHLHSHHRRYAAHSRRQHRPRHRQSSTARGQFGARTGNCPRPERKAQHDRFQACPAQPPQGRHRMYLIQRTNSVGGPLLAHVD